LSCMWQTCHSIARINLYILLHYNQQLCLSMCIGIIVVHSPNIGIFLTLGSGPHCLPAALCPSLVVVNNTAWRNVACTKVKSYGHFACIGVCVVNSAGGGRVRCLESASLTFRCFARDGMREIFSLIFQFGHTCMAQRNVDVGYADP
jgi:hypothetical protein